MRTFAIHLAFSIISIILVTSFLGCETSPKNKVEAAKENLTQAEKDFTSELNDFKKLSVATIADYEKAIDDLKKKNATSKKKTKADFQKKLADLEQKTADLKKKMADYKEDGKDTWKAFQNEYNYEMDALKTSIKKLVDDIS